MKTNKLNKVLIALDYDPSAQKVAESGLLLAKNEEVEFTILHVISESSKYSLHKHITIMGFSGQNEIVPSQLDSVDKVKNIAQLYLEKTKHHLSDNSIQTLVKEGDIADSILNTAKELLVDAIVLGFNGHKMEGNLPIASIAEKVLQHTSIPLFIIPASISNNSN